MEFLAYHGCLASEKEDGGRFVVDFKATVDLAAAEQSGAEPELSLSFTVKDRFALQERVLTDAAQKARKNAEILAKASGVTLGALQSVTYHDPQHEPLSATRCNLVGMAKGAAMCDGIAINPEDITAEETAVFVWEIE